MKPSPQLRQLCLAGGQHSLALVSGSIRTADDLRRAALAMAAGLQQRSEHTWALWLTSPYEFLSAFLALALAGKRILLPGNMQAGTALGLAAHIDALLTRATFPGLTRPSATPEQLKARPEEARAQLEGDIELLLFTSGSTGEPKAIAKTLALLEAELGVLQSHWGETLGTLPVLATVSHQHIYGLLHHLLWPLVRKAPFVDELCQYPEDLLARAQQQGSVVLVSSPTHLKRLPLVEGFARQQSAIARIVSSGGLLETDAALTLARIMGKAPLEILGSTETGGVAWRQQDQSEHWRALPGVSCRRDTASECLAVASAHLGDVAPEGEYLMGDRVVFHEDGSFSLCGRADQLAKVEGKRLSITEMETRLQEHPFIARARILVVRAKREEVGAVVELTAEGWQQLDSAGSDRTAASARLALNQTLRDYLLTFFERPLLPRRWRYLQELPVNAQGKVVLSDLQALLLRREH